MSNGANFTIASDKFSDWFTHQILRNLRKAACMFIPSFLTSFLITKSRPSLNNTEKKTPFKMEFKYI